VGSNLERLSPCRINNRKLKPQRGGKLKMRRAVHK
jgi:hypothetical protein